MSEDPARVEGSSLARTGEAARETCSSPWRLPFILAYSRRPPKHRSLSFACWTLPGLGQRELASRNASTSTHSGLAWGTSRVRP
jgi:hypothetical protein